MPIQESVETQPIQRLQQTQNSHNCEMLLERNMQPTNMVEKRA